MSLQWTVNIIKSSVELFSSKLFPLSIFYSVIMSKPLLCHSGRHTTPSSPCVSVAVQHFHLSAYDNQLNPVPLHFCPSLPLSTSFPLLLPPHTLKKWAAAAMSYTYISLFSLYASLINIQVFYSKCPNCSNLSLPLEKCADLLVSYLFKIKKLECKQTKCTVKGLCEELMV